MKEKQPCFKNVLERTHYEKKLSQHRANLINIAKSSNRDYIIKEPYKKLLQDSLKPDYLRQTRNKEINLENYWLGRKIHDIQQKKISKNKYQKTNYSKSLNQFIRKDNDRKIKEENVEFVKRIQSQKPQLSIQKLKKSSTFQQDLAKSISKQSKYKLPGLTSRYSSIQSLDRSSKVLNEPPL